MPLYNPSMMQAQAAQQKQRVVAAAIEHCSEKIRDAMSQDKTSVRNWTGIEYGDMEYLAVDSALDAAGFRVNSSVSLRHGHIVDVEWDAQ